MPLPELELTPSEVTDREKAFWEKELLGVSFSEKPFSPVFSSATPNTKFCEEISVELDGQNVVLAGRVVSARYLLTKDGRSFASAVLEDFSGQVEVMVWPKVYADTEELWKEGNELIIQGKVRVREDRAQISCDSVRLYQPPQEGERAGRQAAPTSERPEVPAEKTVVTPAARHLLIINMQQTDDAEGDIARLGKIVSILKDLYRPRRGAIERHQRRRGYPAEDARPPDRLLPGAPAAPGGVGGGGGVESGKAIVLYWS